MNSDAVDAGPTGRIRRAGITKHLVFKNFQNFLTSFFSWSKDPDSVFSKSKWYALDLASKICKRNTREGRRKKKTEPITSFSDLELCCDSVRGGFEPFILQLGPLLPEDSDLFVFYAKDSRSEFEWVVTVRYDDLDTVTICVNARLELEWFEWICVVVVKPNMCLFDCEGCLN